MDAFQNGASSIQAKQSSVSLKAQQFREEQLCAFQTLGAWQQDGYKSYSSFDFSSLDDTTSTLSNSVASVLNTSISAAILAKKRVLKWQEERSQSLKCGGSRTSEKNLTEDNSALFKVPLPKPATETVELHDWYFGLRSRNWVLIGRMIDERGRTKKYTSKSLLQYFEREKARRICSVDKKKVLILSGPCALAECSPDQIDHPKHIKKTFRHGFPTDWKKALLSWSEFQLQGQPEDFPWPSLDTTQNSACSTICSNFTSVTDRIAPMGSTTGEPSTISKIIRNIGVEVDSRYALNKFLSGNQDAQSCTSSVVGSLGPDPSNQLLNGAELSLSNRNKTRTNGETLKSAAFNHFPNVEWPAKKAIDVSYAPARLSLKDHHIESLKDDKSSEQRNVVETFALHHLDESGKRLPSNISNHSRRSSSKQRSEKTLSQPKLASTNSSKKDHLESRKNGDSSEPRNLVRTSSSRVHASNEIVPSSVDISSRSDSTKQEFKQILHTPKTTSSNSSKENHTKAQGQGNEKESRIPPSPANQRLVAIETAVKSKVLQSFNQIKPDFLESRNQPVGYRTNLTDATSTQLLKGNNLVSVDKSRLKTTDDRCYKNLCGKAIDPRCSLEWCWCRLFSNRVMVLELTKIDGAGSTEQEPAKKMRKSVETSEAASHLKMTTKKSNPSPSVLALANWYPVMSDTCEELMLAGDVIDSDEHVVEKSHVSCPVEVRRKGILYTSDGNGYSLVGTLSKLAKKGIPRDIAKRFFKNDLFPFYYKKMIEEWKCTYHPGSRASSRQRAKPIEFWKVHDQHGRPTDHLIIKKKRGPKHKESNDSDLKKCQWNQQRRQELPSDSGERSRKSTRISRNVALEKASNRSRRRLRRWSPPESSSDESNSRKHKCPFPKNKFKKLRNPSKCYSSDTSTDLDGSGNDRRRIAHTSKQIKLGKRRQLQTAVHSSQNQKFVDVKNVANKKYKKLSNSDSEERECPNISQSKTAARCRPIRSLAKSVQTGNCSHESDNLPRKLARNHTRRYVDEVETLVVDDSKVQCVATNEVASGPPTSLLSKSKIVSYPWMSDADTSIDSDSDVQGIRSSIRLRQSDSCNTEKNHQNVDKSSSHTRSTCTNASNPVPDMEASILGLTKMSIKISDKKPDANNSQLISRSGHFNTANDQCVMQSTTRGHRNVDDTSFDNMSVSVIFSETDPRAARFE